MTSYFITTFQRLCAFVNPAKRVETCPPHSFPSSLEKKIFKKKFSRFDGSGISGSFTGEMFTLLQNANLFFFVFFGLMVSWDYAQTKNQTRWNGLSDKPRKNFFLGLVMDFYMRIRTFFFSFYHSLEKSFFLKIKKSFFLIQCKIWCCAWCLVFSCIFLFSAKKFSKSIVCHFVFHILCFLCLSRTQPLARNAKNTTVEKPQCINISFFVFHFYF